MSDITLLGTPQAVAAMQASGARGFLGLDPVTQNEALLGKELAALGAQVFQYDATLLGARSNPVQPRQAYLDSTSDDSRPVHALVEFLDLYQRCDSFVAQLPAGNPAITAFARCGFQHVGTLREHLFHSGGYHDVLVYFARGEDICLS